MAGDDDNSADEDGEKGAAGEGNQEEEEVVTSPVAILSIDCSTDNSLVISGCADSTAKVFNVSSGKVCLCVVFSLGFQLLSAVCGSNGLFHPCSQCIFLRTDK